MSAPETAIVVTLNLSQLLQRKIETKLRYHALAFLDNGGREAYYLSLDGMSIGTNRPTGAPLTQYISTHKIILSKIHLCVTLQEFIEDIH